MTSKGNLCNFTIYPCNYWGLMVSTSKYISITESKRDREGLHHFSMNVPAPGHRYWPVCAVAYAATTVTLSSSSAASSASALHATLTNQNINMRTAALMWRSVLAQIPCMAATYYFISNYYFVHKIQFLLECLRAPFCPRALAPCVRHQLLNSPISRQTTGHPKKNTVRPLSDTANNQIVFCVLRRARTHSPQFANK